MTKVGVHTIYMKKSHPDFAQAMQHCLDYGRLKNGLTLLLRTAFFYPRGIILHKGIGITELNS